jgi:hypothetical protein
MSRSQSKFLIKQTLTSIFLNGLFGMIAVLLVFRHLAMVPLSGSPGLIADSILQTFIATFMSTLPPSFVSAKWISTRQELTTARTPAARIWFRSLLTTLAAGLASFMVLPFAMPRLLAASLPFWNMLLLKCLYSMLIGLAATPFAVSAVLRGPRRRQATEELHCTHRNIGR